MPSESIRPKAAQLVTDTMSARRGSSGEEIDETMEPVSSPEQHQAELSDQDNTMKQPLRRMPSDVSISALRQDHASATSPASTAMSPITPSLTTGTSVATTDDEETDFQSAYSTSPRGSYASFENFAVMTEGEDSDVDRALDEQKDPLSVLNYPLQDEHSFKCSLYDTPVHQQPQGDVQVTDAVRAL